MPTRHPHDDHPIYFDVRSVMKGNDDELASFSIDVADVEDAGRISHTRFCPASALAAEPSTARV
jgi:hypothetical protein